MLNIKQRQMNLNFLNYATNGTDGIEGTKTKQAYRSFQRDFNLKLVDGIYGKETDTRLIEVIKDIQNKIGTVVDGVAGTNTIAKCKEYQKAHGLAVDGICGIATRNSLNNEGLSWDSIKHFKKEEFACKCGCGLNRIDLRLVQVLEQIRTHFGDKPIIVTSGCRCSKHNKNVGGVQGSRHVLGKASDIYVQGVSAKDLLAYTTKLMNEGKIRYTYTNGSNMNGVVHVDIE